MAKSHHRTFKYVHVISYGALGAHPRSCMTRSFPLSATGIHNKFSAFAFSAITTTTASQQYDCSVDEKFSKLSNYFDYFRAVPFKIQDDGSNAKWIGAPRLEVPGQ